MQQTDIECPEDGCERTLRARDHGGVEPAPVRRRNKTLVPPSEVGQCAVLRKSDGERCPHDTRAERAHVCGVHVDALERGFALTADLRTLESAHPHGREFECPIHGLVDEGKEQFPPHVRKAALSG